MSTSFKTRFWKLFRLSTFLFFCLFIFQLIYGYIATDAGSGRDYSSDFFSGIENLRKNYASEKMSMKSGDVQVQSAIASNQKFEKTASIKTKTAAFEKDEQQLKQQVKQFRAVIQYEQNLGQKGNRQAHLLIGVNPERFDSFYIAVQKIGVVKAMEITKVDKTNEYRQLNAKKTSIEKTLQSLNELKTKAGEIGGFVLLNEKILEVEEKLQALGVELGNFDTENEFCTVKLSLYEGAAEKNISFIHRVKVAFEWSIKYFAVIVFTLLGGSLMLFLFLLIVDKLKVLNVVNAKLNQ